MNPRAICATVSLAVVVSLTAEPGSVRAEGGREWQGNGRAGVPQRVAPPRPIVPPSGFVPSPGFGFVPPPAVSRPVMSRPFVHRPFARSAPGIAVYVPSPVWPESPDSFQPPVPDDQGMFYAPPADMVPAPPPSVIEYPGGRYELRGDGGATPYWWVWVPNPPPAPPAGPPPAAFPARPVPPAPPGPPQESEVYRYTDEQGVVNWTDRWDTIPQQYRGQAKRLPL
jgi:hypothetical protein